MIRSKKSLRALAALAGVAALTLSACGTTGGDDDKKGSDAKAACDQKLTYFGALTGPAAALGINAANGADLAIEQYNKEHADCKVIFEKVDSQSDPKQATGLAANVIGDKKVIGVIGPLFSGESEAADPVFDKAGLPLISASATRPSLSEQGWKVFHRVLGNDATQGPQVTTLLKEVANISEVFVVEDDSPYGKGLSATVQGDMGDGVVGVESVKTGETDFSGVINTIQAKKPASVFFSGYYPEGGPFVKQLRAAGYTGTVVTADGVKDPEFIKLAGAQAAEGTLITCPCVPGEKLTEFNDAYVAKFKVAPGTYSPEAYDAANIFLAGIESGISDRAEMLDFVNDYDEDALTKHIKFDDKGEVTEIPIWGYKVEGGNIVPIKQLN
jgi:branched-chain amino acid transport system substrate-binding protein